MLNEIEVVPRCNLNLIVLSDSLYRAHKGFGIKEHALVDDKRHLRTCLCVSSGGALIMPPSSKSKSAIELAMQAFTGSSRLANSLISPNPLVRVLVTRAEHSTAHCRFAEQFPNVVFDRSMSPMIGSLETSWTICDLEDVVQQRPHRRRYAELEICQLRDKRGIYGEPGDTLHFRNDIALEAGDELLKATARTAVMRYGVDLEGNVLLLVLAAGWNADGCSFGELDKRGKAWRKAELIALEELCALNGQPLSIFMTKMRELLRRAASSHKSFLTQPLGVSFNLEDHGSLHRFCIPQAEEACAQDATAGSGDRRGVEKRRRRWNADRSAEGVHAAFSQILRPSVGEVICIDDDNSDAQGPFEIVDSTLNDAALAELVQMGFLPDLATRALSASHGSIPNAIEILCQN